MGGAHIEPGWGVGGVGVRGPGAGGSLEDWAHVSTQAP